MAIFGLAFLALIVLLGLAALVGGIVGLCIIHKKDFPRKGLATGLLIAALVLGALMILLPRVYLRKMSRLWQMAQGL